jgi:hypothetical protein
MPQTSPAGPPLPTERAFVVQFAAETAVEHGRFVGRVEHVVSGQVAHFHTLDALLACLVQMLTALDTAPQAPPVGRAPTTRRHGGD